MFIVIAATVGAPELASKLMADAPQEILPTFIKEYMPFVAQNYVTSEQSCPP